MVTSPWGPPPPGPYTAPSPADRTADGVPGYPAPPGPPAPAGSTAPVPGDRPAQPARRLGNPLPIVLAITIVVALAVAGWLGGELYARHRADTVAAAAVQCVVHDGADVSFGLTPPFLWQYFTGQYRDITIRTAGNKIRGAQGMTLVIAIQDVRPGDHILGALDADVVWTVDGIKKTVQTAVPLGGVLFGSVTTNPADGTVTLAAVLGSVTLRPTLGPAGGLALRVVDIAGPDFLPTRQTVQSGLDVYLAAQTGLFPLGIRADRVWVTDSGVAAHFSTRDATIPQGSDGGCFARL
jgi:DUF2993 family protein